MDSVQIQLDASKIADAKRVYNYIEKVGAGLNKKVYLDVIVKSRANDHFEI